MGGNAAISAFLQRQPQQDPPVATGYVGLNPKAKLEVPALGATMGHGEVLIPSLNDAALEKDLGTEEGIERWLNTVAVDHTRKPAIGTLLRSVNAQARDQVTHLIDMFIGAESGEHRLERLVLSGHSNGVNVWGETADDGGHAGGEIVLGTDLVSIATLFPIGASQVEDIMFSACYSLGAVAICKKAFPALQTCWVYQGQSPLAESGAPLHIAAWSQATSGPGTFSKKDKMGANALWTREQGFVVGDPLEADLASLASDIGSREAEAMDMFYGNKELDNGRLNPLYDLIIRLLNHPNVTEYQMAIYEPLRDRLLRLRYWEKVTATFATTYKTKIEKAHTHVGLEATISTMTRPQALDYVQQWGERAREHEKDKIIVAYYNFVDRALYDLDKSIILNSWI